MQYVPSMHTIINFFNVLQNGLRLRRITLLFLATSQPEVLLFRFFSPAFVCYSDFFFFPIKFCSASDGYITVYLSAH